MKRRVAFGVLALCLGDSTLAEITRPDFSRYEVILLRQPFGEPRLDPQAPPENTPSATPAPPPFTKSLRLCGITVDGDETRVGFLDIGTNPHTSYYLQVGDAMNGIKVVSADYERGSVQLEKDGKQEPLSMDNGAAASSPSTSGGLATPAVPRMAMPPPAVLTDRTSLAERIRQRREELLRMRSGAMPAPPPPATPKAPPPANPAPTNTLSTEERETKLREYNLELIRAKGTKGPPLPIPLTADEDAQLVKEGVLPPQ